MRRLQVYYTGTVQGVGFRFSVRSIARRYPISGFVRNLPDGRVEVVGEGEGESLRAFADEIATAMRAYVATGEVIWGEPTGEFEGFTVRLF